MYKRLHVSGIAPAKRGVPVLLHVFAVEIISIHATCGGGSDTDAANKAYVDISIHAPVWGRALLEENVREIGTLFQFTPPCGGGLQKEKSSHWWIEISIHAPVWGRGYLLMWFDTDKEFQFTPPCGGGAQRPQP